MAWSGEGWEEAVWWTEVVEEKKPFLQVARSYTEQYLRWTHF